MTLPKHYLIITESRTQDGFSVTTTAPNETLTINSFGVSEETTIFWGDGLSDNFTGTALRTHQYAVAGTFNIRISNIASVTTFDLRDNKVTLNSRDIRGMVNVNTFILNSLAAGTFNSSDVSSWSPSVFQLSSMPSGYAGTFNSSDVSSWSPSSFQLFNMPSGYAGTFNSSDVSSWSPSSSFRLTSMPSGYAGTFNSSDVSSWSPSSFQLTSMPSGYAGTFNSSDVSSWSPATFQLTSMPSGYAGTFNSSDVSSWSPTLFRLFNMPSGYVFIFADPDFSNFTTATIIDMSANNLTQSQIDTILFSIYGIGTSRTASSGSITLGGSNAAPSGTLQPAVSCPVDTDTPGKEVVDELLNDGCSLGFNTWATVTFTA